MTHEKRARGRKGAMRVRRTDRRGAWRPLFNGKRGPSGTKLWNFKRFGARKNTKSWHGICIYFIENLLKKNLEESV